MRYIGNKAKLLDEIDKLLQRKKLKIEGLTFCDIFSGTATVSNYYNGFYNIIANDFLDFSYEFSKGILLGYKAKFKKLGFDPFEYFESAKYDDYIEGFCYNTFSPNGGRQYFSDENAKYIDFIRDTIDNWYKKKKITKDEKSYLIMCLLEAISKVSNVAGVYSACLKIWDSRALKKMKFEPIEVKETKYKNEIYCKDANELINKISGDILYLDPPYTPTQYNSQYHVLETIVRNDKPKTHGVGAHRDNDRISKWCKKGDVEVEFEKIIKNAKFKYILFSYSDKGLMSPKFIESVLKRYGKPETYVFKKIDFVKYKSTRSVKKEIKDKTKNKNHYEYLFFIEKNDKPKYISPLNYIGGKFNTLDLILNNLPEKYNNCYDLFGGGATVGINLQAKNIVYNDINKFVAELLGYLAKNYPSDTYRNIQKYIKKYKLEKGNKEAYYKLREDYNKYKNPLLLYLLICFGFEHQIRFNSNFEFNNPCGNSGFNDEMYEKLISFYLICNEKKIKFKCGSFEKYKNKIKEGDFVYLDPPYLGNDGVYQDGKRGFEGWTNTHEKKLYSFMEYINSIGAFFMLSNYKEHTKSINKNLEQFVKENKYEVIEDSKLTKRNRTNRKEIIVVNYKRREPMQIKVKIYSCYQRTYMPIYKRILELIYGDSIDYNNVVVEIEDTSDNNTRNIQAQRRVTKKSIYKGRMIRIYENDTLKHIVGISNTNFDEDREYEFKQGRSNKKVSSYGKDDYHANTYFKQGINQIFEFYFENKDTADLSFYLLDTDKGVNYPNNLFNSLSYRELETIGFKVLNISDINFSEYEKICNSKINHNNLKFASFNKYLKDIAYISDKNTGNVPSFLQCEEVPIKDENGEETFMTDKYTYIFKSLSAQQYDSLLRCWCLKVLADKQNTKIEFKLRKQYFAYELENRKISKELSGPVKRIFGLANLDFKYTTSDDILNEETKAEDTYCRYKEANEIRNQTLFRNNLRKKGVPIECAICGEDDTKLLDAAHLWEINQIKNATTKEINDFIKANNLKEVIENSSKYGKEVFYKKYYLANSGDNGVWLCKNHHRQFDLNYFCFESEQGKVVLKFDSASTALKFQEELKNEKLPDEVATSLSKAFLNMRQIAFNI